LGSINKNKIKEATRAGDNIFRRKPKENPHKATATGAAPRRGLARDRAVSKCTPRRSAYGRL